MMEPAETEPIILPWEVNLAQATKDHYFRKSKFFLEYAGFLDPAKAHHRAGPGGDLELSRKRIEGAMLELLDRLRGNPQSAKPLVIGFIRKQNERIDAGKVSSAEVKGLLKPIKLAFEMNDIPISWRKYSRLIHSGRTTGKDRPYRLEEIKRFYPIASLHLQVPIAMMTSAGVRVGSFDYLNVGDVRPVYKLNGEVVVPERGDLPFEEGLYTMPKDAELLCGCMTIYSDEIGDDYDTLHSKEAYHKWAEYIGSRCARHEKITPKSPAVVTKNLAHRWAAKGIGQGVNDLLWKVGLRTEKKVRHEVQMDHGFRKYYDNTMNDYVDKVYVEMLVGHGTKVGTVDLAVAKHYDRRIPMPAVVQYLRAMPLLSIGEAYRNEAILTAKLEVAEKEKNEDIKELRYKLLEKEQDVEQLKTDMARVLEWVAKGAKVDTRFLRLKPEDTENSA